MKTFEIPFTRNQSKNIIDKKHLNNALQYVYWCAEKRNFVLTDGHKLIIVKPINSKSVFPPESVLIPVDALCSTQKQIHITEYYVQDSTLVRVCNETGSIKKYACGSYGYPKYQNIMPKAETGKPLQNIAFNPLIIAGVGKFLKPFGITSIKFEFFDTAKPVYFEPTDGLKNEFYEFSGIVMPMIINQY